MQTHFFIEKCKTEVQDVITNAEKLYTLDENILRWTPTSYDEIKEAGQWSILACVEHLNLYGDYYLAEIMHAIASSQTKPVEKVKSGFLGAYFAKSMLPKEKLNKMKTFKDKDPAQKLLNKTVIEVFIIQQKKLIALLEQAEKLDVNAIKIRTSISKYVKINLGDTFQFIINHNIRHFAQIENIIKVINAQKN